MVIVPRLLCLLAKREHLNLVRRDGQMLTVDSCWTPEFVWLKTKWRDILERLFSFVHPSSHIGGCLIC
jgi:hypothetical protein